MKKYDTLKIIFPENSYYPQEIVDGFRRFCQDYAFNYKVINNTKDEEIKKGIEVYISVMEDDLVSLMERIMQSGLELGKDTGVISYNETPVKKIILNGITTISTDFYQMGKMAAQIILDGSRKHMEVPFILTLRDSL